MTFSIPAYERSKGRASSGRTKSFPSDKTRHFVTLLTKRLAISFMSVPVTDQRSTYLAGSCDKPTRRTAMSCHETSPGGSSHYGSFQATSRAESAHVHRELYAGMLNEYPRR